jgi:hypothetical protein
MQVVHDKNVIPSLFGLEANKSQETGFTFVNWEEDWNCADTSDLLLAMHGVRQGLRSLLNISSGLP